MTHFPPQQKKYIFLFFPSIHRFLYVQEISLNLSKQANKHRLTRSTRLCLTLSFVEELLPNLEKKTGPVLSNLRRDKYSSFSFASLPGKCFLNETLSRFFCPDGKQWKRCLGLAGRHGLTTDQITVYVKPIH